MTLTVTQGDITRPPLQLVTTGLPVVSSAGTGLVTGVIQRSRDNIRWTDVRGAVDAEIDGSGNLANVNDYEFAPEVLNRYRAGTMQEIVDTFTGTAVDSWGTADTAQVWDAANAAFDKTGGAATILHSAANSTFSTLLGTPTDAGDVRLNTVFTTNANGATGATFTAGVYLRYVDSSNYYHVGIQFATSGATTLRFTKRVSAVSVVTTAALPFTYSSSATVVRLEVWAVNSRVRIRAWIPATEAAPDWQMDEAVGAASRLLSGKVGVETTRATSNTNTNLTFSFTEFVVDTGNPTFLAALTDDITPTLDGFWLTSTMRSFLNCAPMVVAFEEPGRDGRGGSNYVAGRTLPVAQVELMTGRTWTLTMRVPTLASARRLEYVIASGDIFYLLAPADCPIPSGYYRVDRSAPRRVIPRGAVRLFNLPLTECAAPGADTATAQSTWDSVIAAYGTWEDVVAAVPTWEDLLDLVGDPSEVIVE